MYEVGVSDHSRPARVDGIPVVEINVGIIGSYFGVFNGSTLTVTIGVNILGDSLRPGRSVDTPMHELGHLLGLGDIDNHQVFGTHRTLMGYNRETTEENVGDAITYHDIQGVMFANGIHEQHAFDRYGLDGGIYKHVCFYCDTIYASDEPLMGSEVFANAEVCNHEYSPMVSLGDKYWLKCTRCYKVIEQTHLFGVSYLNIDDQSHRSYCACQSYVLEDHSFNDHYVGSGQSSHKSYCICGRYTVNPHVADRSSIITIMGKRYARCALCNSMINLETGIIVVPISGEEPSF